MITMAKAVNKKTKQTAHKCSSTTAKINQLMLDRNGNRVPSNKKDSNTVYSDGITSGCITVSVIFVLIGCILYPILSSVISSINQVQHKVVSKKNNGIEEMNTFEKHFLENFQPKEINLNGKVLSPIPIHHTIPNNSSVRVYIYEDFLSERECNGLMQAHVKHVMKSGKNDPILCFDSITTLRKHLDDAHQEHIKVTPEDFTQGTTCVNATFSSQLKGWFNANWSYSTSFYPGESPFSHVFEERVQNATSLPSENGGKFQITSYNTGIGYKTHTDCIVDGADKRDRFATILVYLHDVASGGETKFPELGISVKPKKGRALVWNNMAAGGHCDPLSVHQAAKVNQGHKFILQRWYYYQNFYSLGKRTPEPSIPQRETGQPRVSCDEYDHGSCRWYDEWNYGHITEYESIKHTLT